MVLFELYFKRMNLLENETIYLILHFRDHWNLLGKDIVPFLSRVITLRVESKWCYSRYRKIESVLPWWEKRYKKEKRQKWAKKKNYFQAVSSLVWWHIDILRNKLIRLWSRLEPEEMMNSKFFNKRVAEYLGWVSGVTEQWSWY